MVSLIINGMEVQAEEGWTLLEAIRWVGFDVPTLCYNPGLTPYGACRLCVVEIGKEPRIKLVSSCTYPVEEGLIVRTHSKRVVNARKMIVELMLASSPQSKTVQDLASQLGVQQIRFKVEHEDCLLCGLCVRMCAEQMMAKAIDFAFRGSDRKITTPFDMKSEECRRCGACMYICPACQLRCAGPEAEQDICNACLQITPECLQDYDDVMCYLTTCGACQKKPEGKTKETNNKR
ncbi:MAG: 2Fe-2S iron-sulfur cluster-binding protein [Candidatus Aminicenantes bacterium]|nr:2Fe-2S iron-sulfur cluster-binding protein [Candidatus Aminicenantes bacterium]